MPIKPKKLQKFQRIFAAIVLAAVLLLPVLPIAVSADYWNPATNKCEVSATVKEPPCGFKGLIYGIIDGILKPLIPFIIALAVVIFLWGVLKFIMAAGDEKKRGEGRDSIIWGLIGITIMVSIWGLVKILTDTLNLDNTIPTIPQLTQLPPPKS